MSEEIVITTKSDREHARLRPGMYLPNKNYLFYEIIDNSVDEHIDGYGNTIEIIMNEDIISVQDFGRGLPIAPCVDDPTVSSAERAMSSLRAGGKFGDAGNYSSKTGGLNGVGAAVVNFLSKKFDIIIKKKDGMYSLTFEDGICTNKLAPYIGPNPSPYKEDETGTLIIQQVDQDLWKDKDDFDIPALIHRLRFTAFLNAGLKIKVHIDYKDEHFEDEFLYSGLEDCIEYIAKGDDITDVFHNTLNSDEIDIDFAFKYTEGSTDTGCPILTFTNNIENIDGGHHLTGLKEGLFNAIKDYYAENNFKSNINFESEDCRDGFFGVLSIKVKDPNFDGQGKTKLNMPKVRGHVRNFVYDTITEILDKNPNIAKQIINKVLDAARSRESAKRARESAKKSKTLTSGFVEGLTKCNSNEPEKCEIFLVEGDSAGGSAKQARDKHIQAILPVFGKINNTEGNKISDIINSKKLSKIIKALGCGIGSEFNIDNLKYDKIIILADGDVDGLHIQTLWITFFYLHMRPIVDEGHLYLACPPLYSITHNKQTTYLYTEDSKIKYVEEHSGEKMDIVRFKGLGEMKATELWESTMNPESRVLIRIDSSDIASSLDMISLCMSDDASRRREFIMNNSVEDLELFE